MSPMWAVSASDAMLAGVAIAVSVRLAHRPLAPLPRATVVVGLWLFALAAIAGCLRFAGFAALAPLHATLSDQAAIVGLPAVLTVVLWERLDQRLPHRALALAAAGLLLALALSQSRTIAALACAALVLAALLIPSARGRAAPALLLVGLAALASAKALPLPGAQWQLVWLHAVLAAVLLIAQHALIPQTVSDLEKCRQGEIRP